MFHLLASGIFGMGFKNLQDFFDPKDSTNSFIHLHQLCSHVAVSQILESMVRIFGAFGF